MMKNAAGHPRTGRVALGLAGHGHIYNLGDCWPAYGVPDAFKRTPLHHPPGCQARSLSGVSGDGRLGQLDRLHQLSDVQGVTHTDRASLCPG